MEASVDKGEARVIALPIELNGSQVIIYDRKGRKFAYELSFTIIGTAEIIVDAKLAGILASVRPILAKIRTTKL